MNVKFLIIPILFFCHINSIAQNNTFILEGDSINVPCTPGCITLHGVHPNFNQSTTYTVNTIPFAPVSVVGTPISFVNDDYFSDTINIGFEFCFFNQVYSKVCISDNGQITFNQTYKNAQSSFATQTALPFFNNAYPDNAIFGPFIDAKLSLGGTVTYATAGNSPNRKFIVKYNSVPYFNNGCTNTSNNNYQIILYETTNVIETHISNKEVCNSNASNWLNYSTLGIQNSLASMNYTVAGKNASVWTASNEAYQFAPNGAVVFTSGWKTINGSVISNNDSVVHCPFITNDTLVYFFKTQCPDITYRDTIILSIYKPLIDSLIITQPTCAGYANGCITVIGASNSSALQYAIYTTNFQSTNQFCNLTSGAYLVTIMDANGCVSSKNITIQNASTLNIVVDFFEADSCPLQNGGIAIHATGGNGPYTYLWNNGATDTFLQNINGSLNYSVIATDANNCTSYKVFVLSQNGNPEADAIITKPQCSNANGSIALTTTGSLAPYHYLWSSGDTTSTISNKLSGSYSVVITAANGCDKYYSFSLSDTLSISIIANVMHTYCGDTNGKIIVNINGGIPPFTIYVNNILQTSNNITNLAPNNYTIKVIDATGCSKTLIDSVQSSIKPIITLNVSSPNCDSINGKIGVVLSNFVGSINYLWSNGDSTNTLMNADTGTYYVTVTDQKPCTVSSQVHLTRTPTPHLQITSYKAPKCFGDSTGSVSLTVNGGIPTYKYSIDNINFSAVAQINNISGGNYTIYCKDASGCKRDSVVSFYQPSLLSISINGLHPLICFDDVLDSITIAGAGGVAPYLYGFDDVATDTKTIFKNIYNGVHFITIKDYNNCEVQQSFMADGPTEKLDVTLAIKDVPCFENNKGEINANIGGGWGNYKISWSNGDSIHFIEKLKPDQYQITVTDAKGCSLQSVANIYQTSCCKAVVPNVFSPNKDGKNDILYAIGISEINSVRFRIYNRFGATVFETDNMANGWDGKLKNVDCDMGTYFYLLEFSCPFEKEKIISKGDVTLVR